MFSSYAIPRSITTVCPSDNPTRSFISCSMPSSVSRSCRFPCCTPGVQLVEITVKRILCKVFKINPQYVFNSRASYPIRHCMFRQWENQTVQCHSACQSLHPLIKPSLTQYHIQPKSPPKLITYMHRACL